MSFIDYENCILSILLETKDAKLAVGINKLFVPKSLDPNTIMLKQLLERIFSILSDDYDRYLVHLAEADFVNCCSVVIDSLSYLLRVTHHLNGLTSFRDHLDNSAAYHSLR